VNLKSTKATESFVVHCNGFRTRKQQRVNYEPTSSIPPRAFVMDDTRALAALDVVLNMGINDAVGRLGRAEAALVEARETCPVLFLPPLDKYSSFRFGTMTMKGRCSATKAAQEVAHLRRARKRFVVIRGSTAALTTVLTSPLLIG
jgi:hypothetical protein